MRTDRKTSMIGLILAIGLASTVFPAFAQTTIYVDDDPGPGVPDGSSLNPWPTIAQGISAALSGNRILVLAGTYN